MKNKFELIQITKFDCQLHKFDLNSILIDEL